METSCQFRIEIKMDQSNSIQLLHEIVIKIFQLKTLFMDKGDQLVTPFGLTSTQWQILGAISMSNKPITVPQIAGFMGLTRQGVQKQINYLIAEKLCRPHMNPKNLRSPQYALTDKGNNVFAQIMSISDVWIAGLGENIKFEDLFTTLRVLTTLSDRLPTSSLGEDDE